MAIALNHTIVPARDKQMAARWFADLFGLEALRSLRSRRSGSTPRR